MTYNTRTATYEDYRATLEAENKYVLSLFFKKIIDTELWYSHCFNESDITREKMRNELISFVGELDSELMEKVQSRVDERNLQLEVNEHFMQDKSELELWQDFEMVYHGDAHQDKIDMYRNEY